MDKQIKERYKNEIFLFTICGVNCYKEQSVFLVCVVLLCTSNLYLLKTFFLFKSAILILSTKSFSCNCENSSYFFWYLLSKTYWTSQTPSQILYLLNVFWGTNVRLLLKTLFWKSNKTLLKNYFKEAALIFVSPVQAEWNIAYDSQWTITTSIIK